jgi:single-stranded DNA-specific DHH superfamily exonuclease
MSAAGNCFAVRSFLDALNQLFILGTLSDVMPLLEEVSLPINRELQEYKTSFAVGTVKWKI